MISNKSAEMGIGTLIIFIALLLVAAVAAGVLIQTTGSLQEKALTTGDQARGQIATNVKVIEVSGTDGQDGAYEDYTMIMKLAPGSESIKLTDAILTSNTYNTSLTLSYNDNATVNERNQTSGYWTNSESGVGNYTIEYLQTGSNHVDGNLQRGDVIKLYFAAARNITEDESIRLNFIPKIGTPTLVEFNTPEVIATKRVYLYP